MKAGTYGFACVIFLFAKSKKCGPIARTEDVVGAKNWLLLMTFFLN